MINIFIQEMYLTYVGSTSLQLVMESTTFKKGAVQGLCKGSATLLSGANLELNIGSTTIVDQASLGGRVGTYNNYRYHWTVSVLSLLSNLYHLSILMAYGCILFLFISCITFIFIFDCSWRGVLDTNYVIKFVSDLRQVGGFLRVLRFPQQ